VSGPAAGSSAAPKRHRPTRKYAMSKVPKGAFGPRGGRASPSEKEAVEDAAVASCTATAAKEELEEEASRGLSRMQRDESSLCLGRSLPSAAPMKLNFSTRRCEM
jgi:hypothetical protein